MLGAETNVTNYFTLKRRSEDFISTDPSHTTIYSACAGTLGEKSIPQSLFSNNDYDQGDNLSSDSNKQQHAYDSMNNEDESTSFSPSFSGDITI